MGVLVTKILNLLLKLDYLKVYIYKLKYLRLI